MAKTLKQILLELSKEALTNYAIKASSDRYKQMDKKNEFLLHRNSYESDIRQKTMPISQGYLDKYKLKMKNRTDGIKKAVDKIAKDK
jgi:hypothetical protein